MKLVLFIFSILFITSIIILNVNEVDADTIIKLAQAPSCNDADLADYYNVPFPAQNSPATISLINCVNTNIPNSAMIDAGQIYTYQLDPEKINYTRGNRVCGLDVACSTADCHAVNSCHYGGHTGTQGAEAVDFNAAVGFTEAALFEEIKKLVFPGGACYGQAKYVILEGDHTHMSTNVDAGCDTANIPGLASAPSQTPTAPPASVSVPLPNPIGGGDVITIMLRVLQSALAVVDIFALFMFIWGGFQFLTSAGNQERIKKAKDTLIWATIGIVVITFSYTVMKFVFESVANSAS